MKPTTSFLHAICFFALIVCAASCRKSTQQQQQYSFAYTDFPSVNTGDWWRYRVVDTTYGTVDTVTMTVVSGSIFNATRSFTCTINKAGLTVDTGYLALSDTAVTFNSNLLSGYKLKLPFNTGDARSFHFGGDSIQALSYTAGYSVLGKSYNVFSLKRHLVVPDYALDANFQVAKGIGLVNMGFAYASWLPEVQRRSAQLIDYHIQ